MHPHDFKEMTIEERQVAMEKRKADWAALPDSVKQEISILSRQHREDMRANLMRSTNPV
jgi:hypothetical protein